MHNCVDYTTQKNENAESAVLEDGLMTLSMTRYFNEYNGHPRGIDGNNIHKIFFIDRGELRIRVQNGYYECLPGSVFFACTQPVIYTERTRECDGFVLLISRGHIEMVNENREESSADFFFDTIPPRLLNELTRIQRADLMVCLRQYLATLSGNSVDKMNQKGKFFFRKLLLLLREICNKDYLPLGSQSVEHQYYNEFLGKLKSNKDSSRSVDYYSRELSITSKKLNRITKAVAGISAKKVIEEQLLIEMKKLLLYSDRTLKEISFVFGFNDPTNFNKYFKKRVLETPGHYRRLMDLVCF